MDFDERIEFTSNALDSQNRDQRRIMDEGIDRFCLLYSDLSVEQLQETAGTVYASNAVFNDTLKTLQGGDRIEEYLIDTARRASAVTVKVENIAYSGPNIYLRWQMDITWKKIKDGQTTRSPGVTLLRFNGEGKVILHQDFWDSTGGFFIHLPLIGWLIRKVIQKV